MPDLALDLRYLRYAMLAAEQGSFRRAAGFLDLSESTVSRRILLLERRLGVALFERRRTGVTLTPAGRRFIDEARIGVAYLNNAIHKLKQAQNGLSGELHVGLITSLASGFLSDLLADFHARFPDIEINVEEGTSQAVASSVLAGRLDVAFMPGEPQFAECESILLFEEALFVAFPEQHAFAEESELNLQDLRDETFLVTAQGAGPDIESYLLRHLSGQGAHPRISIQQVGRDNLMNMVAKGFGITVTTTSTVGPRYPGVLFRPIVEPPEVISSSIVWMRSNQNPALSPLLALALKSRVVPSMAGTITPTAPVLPWQRLDRSK